MSTTTSKIVRIQTSRLIKPLYDDEITPPPTSDFIPLNIFDKVTYNTHMAVLYAFRPPTPSNVAIELGLRRVLALYKVMAGQLGENQKGNPVILLNDNGVRFVEAFVEDETFDKFLPLESSPMLLNFHPELKNAEEVTLVQLTRFACGSLVLGCATHHYVTDGSSASNFLVAWGRAARGVELNSAPSMDRSIFWPRDPPEFGFDHIGVEYKTKSVSTVNNHDRFADLDIVNHKVHFTLDFIGKLKAKASAGRPNGVAPYSTFVTLVAHLWRAITKARRLSPLETTSVRISINGRTRVNLDPPVPSDFFGNLVLWAFPTARVKELVGKPLGYATKVIHDAIARVDDGYFKSFIDFASAAEKDGGGGDRDLVPTADMGKAALWPDLEVDSWLRFPFYDLDFGGGCPFLFMPSYYPTEGMMFLLPSFLRDGSVDAAVPLFRQNSAAFKEICYSMD